MMRAVLLAALLLPGVGPSETRVRVDPLRAPWNAVVRVQIPGVSRCTGFAIAPRIILTAAHCLFAPRTGRLLPASVVHVVSGYDRGTYARHAVAVALRVDPAYVPGAFGADVAALSLPAPVTDAVLTLAVPYPGEAAMLGGYSQDYSEVILADTGCRVMGAVDGPGGLLLQHTCEGTHGTSGAPLLVRDGGGRWAAAGVQVAIIGGPVAGSGEAGGLAVPEAALAGVLER